MKSKRIFDARGAPEDEVAGVREALAQSGIEFYETRAGNWGLGNAAIWVVNEQDRERARQVVDAFQAQWLLKARDDAQVQPIRWVMLPAILLAVALVAWVSYQLTRW